MQKLFSEENFREMGLTHRVNAVFTCFACNHEQTFDNREAALKLLEEHFITSGHIIRLNINEEIIVDSY